MNSIKKRMGGFIAAEIIKVSNIESFIVKDGKVDINFTKTLTPSYLDIVKNGVTAIVSSVTSKSGILYDINITIEAKDYNYPNYSSFNKYLAVLTLPNGDRHVFGAPQFPLSITAEPLYSKSASGSTGVLFKITGKQPDNVLLMR